MPMTLISTSINADSAKTKFSIAAPQNIKSMEIIANNFGAKGDGISDDTIALQKAIDATAEKNATLILKPGTYLTGSLFLKSNMALRLDKNVTLIGKQNIEDYPRQKTRIAGIEIVWPSALLNVYEQSDVRIYGEGTIDGNGIVFWQSFWDKRNSYEGKGLRWAADYDAERPRLIQVYNSSRVELGDGLHLIRAGFWTLQIVYSNNVKISGVVIRNNSDGKGPSTDGIDVDSSHHVLVEKADIDVNDDALCLKAGRDADGLRVNRPTEHVVIRDSIIRHAEAGVTFGSETSGSIRHIDVYNLEVIGPVYSGIFFKSAHVRGGTVSNISIRNMTIKNAEAAVRVDLNWLPVYSYPVIPPGIKNIPEHWKILATPVPKEKGIPHLQDIEISDIEAEANVAFLMQAYAEAPLKNMRFKNLKIKTSVGGAITHATGFSFNDVTLETTDPDPVMFENVSNTQGEINYLRPLTE
jgi:polygalacturonase